MKTFKNFLLAAAILFNSCAMIATTDKSAVMPPNFGKAYTGCWDRPSSPVCDKSIYGPTGHYGVSGTTGTSDANEEENSDANEKEEEDNSNAE